MTLTGVDGGLWMSMIGTNQSLQSNACYFPRTGSSLNTLKTSSCILGAVSGPREFISPYGLLLLPKVNGGFTSHWLLGMMYPIMSLDMPEKNAYCPGI